MKRLAIITTVLVAHLVVLAWFIRGCQYDNSIAPPDAGRTAGSGENGAIVDNQPGTGGSDSGSGSDVPDGGGSFANGGFSGSGHSKRPVNIYQPQQFEPAKASLPNEMHSYVKSCRSGVLLDFTSNRLLWSKAPKEAVPVASMTKMMTVLLLMESLESQGDLSLDTRVPVTRSAAAIGGRQVYLDPREQLTIEELLKCTVIRSANDTAFLIAEYLSMGDVQAFVRRMNRRADELGFPSARFSTPHGLPLRGAEVDKASPMELAYLAHLLLQYPAVTKWSSTRLDSIRGEGSQFPRFQLVNTNGLVGKVAGVNGMKTGYTDDAGYCMTATCIRNGRTLVAVVTGCRTGASRDEFVKQLFEWGYEQ